MLPVGKKEFHENGILFSFRDESNTYDVFGVSPYLSEPITPTCRYILVKRVLEKTGDICWITWQQNLRVPVNANGNPVEFEQDFGRVFFYGRYFNDNPERAYKDWIKRIRDDMTLSTGINAMFGGKKDGD